MEEFNCILLIGPRASGKTSTILDLANDFENELFFKYLLLIYFSFDFSSINKENFWKKLEDQIISSLISYGIYEKIYNYLKNIRKEKILENIIESFFTIFSVLKEITKQKIILTFDELDNIFRINSEDRDMFLAILRSLKSKKDEHNIIVKFYLIIVNNWYWNIWINRYKHRKY